MRLKILFVTALRLHNKYYAVRPSLEFVDERAEHAQEKRVVAWQ